MKKLALAASAAAATMLAAASAQAAVYISFDGSTTAFSQPGDGVFSFIPDCGVAGANCGGFENVTVEGSAPTTAPGLLHSDTVSVNAPSSGAATLTIWVTRTDLTDLGNSFFSSFTTNNQGGAVDVTLETLISSSNALFGGTSLASFHNNTIGSDSDNDTTAFVTGPGTYSVTERYTFSAPASGVERSASPTVTLATAVGGVPEPATWSLMILGFGGAGAMIRSRRQRVATAA